MNLTGVLNSHAALMRVTARAKRWWTPELEAKQQEYGRTERLYHQRRVRKFCPEDGQELLQLHSPASETEVLREHHQENKGEPEHSGVSSNSRSP